jgi:hypothetical protein
MPELRSVALICSFHRLARLSRTKLSKRRISKVLAGLSRSHTTKFPKVPAGTRIDLDDHMPILVCSFVYCFSSTKIPSGASIFLGLNPDAKYHRYQESVHDNHLFAV